MKTVLDLARQAGWTGPEDNLAYISMLERFAKLVLAHNPPQSFMSWQEGYEAGKAAKRPWVGLTDEEIKSIEETTTCLGDESWLRNLTRNLEAKLKEKNT